MESVISSHVAREADGFTKNLTVNDTASFKDLAGYTFPTEIVDQIHGSELYFRGGECLTNWHKCYTDVVRDAMFMTNARAVYEAYKGKCYMLNYRWPEAALAFHGTDLLLTFFYKEVPLKEILQNLNATKWSGLIGLGAPILEKTSGHFQKYLTSHAISSEPGKYKSHGLPDWPHPEDGYLLKKGVMRVRTPFLSRGSAFNTGDLPWNPSDHDTNYVKYKFWYDIVDRITEKYSVASSKITGEGGAWHDEL